MNLLSLSLAAAERGLIPDMILRASIRRLCQQRLLDCRQTWSDSTDPETRSFRESLRSGPLAPVPEKANEQHYELPPEFFEAVLGPHRKYSSCFWGPGIDSLADAEEEALRITCERAELSDGQNVLELGCGWGSLSLWMAECFPRSCITSVSNSAPQRRFIQEQARKRGLSNLQVLTADMNHFTPPSADFDRVVSVEMFEHMRNYRQLLERISSWLNPDGRLFVHHFCHKEFAYPFESSGEADWMARYFFTGGQMPSEHLLGQFDEHLTVSRQWRWDGRHYQRTAEAWLANLDLRRSDVMPILRAAYGPSEARIWFHRWRLFFLAVAELFGCDQGNEWFVAHLLLTPTSEIGRIEDRVPTSVSCG